MRVDFHTVLERYVEKQRRAYSIEVTADVEEGVGYERFALVTPFVKVHKVVMDNQVLEPPDMVLELTPDEVIALEPEALRRL